MKNSTHHNSLLPKNFLFVTILFLSFCISHGTTRAEDSRMQTTSSLEYSAEIARGIDLLYDHQFKASEEIFIDYINKYPEKPAGYFYSSMVTWSRLASGFWSPVTVDEFKRRIEKTIDISKARIESENASSDDYFYLGGALGFSGRFELMRENWLTSFFLAREAIDALNICFEKNPSNKDVLLGIGTFDYYTARLSGILKFLSYLLIHKGDVQEGLKKLHEASEKAVYSATEAKSTLLHIYLFIEEDFTKANTLAEELSKKYDNNSRFKVLLGVSQVRLGMKGKVKETILALRKKSKLTNYSSTAIMWENRALYLEAIDCLYNKEYQEARRKLAKILAKPDAVNGPLMIAWPLVKIGMSYQLSNQGRKAERYYQRVIDMENGAGAQFLAKRLLKKTDLDENDPFLGY